jgi:hypothetical protein
MSAHIYTLAEITEAMRGRERIVAPGGESMAWEQYCLDARRKYGVMPYSDSANGTEVADRFAAEWLAFARDATPEALTEDD